MSQHEVRRLLATGMVLAFGVLAFGVLAAGPAAAHGDGDGHDLLSTPTWLGDIPGLGGLAPDPPPEEVPVRLAGCSVTNPLLRESPHRVRGFVPDDYELAGNAFFGPGAATLIVAYVPCAEVGVDGAPPTPGVLSLIAVQVVADPIGDGHVDALYDLYNRSTLNLLPSSSWYLLSAQTDHAALAARLAGAGLPVEPSPRLRFHADYDGSVKRDAVEIPSRAGDYRVRTATRLPDVFTHNHDWFFWHNRAGERSGFILHLHAMDDVSCGYHLSPLVQMLQPSCGAVIEAVPGSRTAAYLGGATRTTPYAFNHPASEARGYIDLSRE